MILTGSIAVQILVGTSSHARRKNGVVLPSGYRLYEEHALQLDGAPNQPSILAHALMMAQ